MSRLADIERFYTLLERLERRLGGTRTLAKFSEFRDWPARGVYLFSEPSEVRRDSGVGSRIVRVGTHALTAGSQSTLRQRLGQHRGLSSGGGNHRGSIFRLLIGQALMAEGRIANYESWGIKGDPTKAAEALGVSREVRAAGEAPIEQAVTRYIGAMPFLWLDIDDQPGPSSLRGFIERNAIALLSNYKRPILDPPSAVWLGRASLRELVRESGLWNQQHVNESHDPIFLDALERVIDGTGKDA